MNTPSDFHLMVTGQIRSGDLNGADNLYCRYTLVYGNDWSIAHGPDTGLSQIAHRGNSVNGSVVWNFPIDVTFRSTNPFGWPRIAISIYGVDGLGRDVVVGYGSLLIPTCPGQYERIVHMYAPVSSSLLQQFLAWVGGTPPEFYDTAFVAQPTGRDVTRVQARGIVRVSLNVLPRGMGSFGYAYGGAGTGVAERVSALTSQADNADARLGESRTFTGGLSGTMDASFLSPPGSKSSYT